MKRHRIKGAIIGVKMECNKWYVRLEADCPLGRAGDVITVSKAERSTDGDLEVQE